MIHIPRIGDEVLVSGLEYGAVDLDPRALALRLLAQLATPAVAKARGTLKGLPVD